MSRSNGRMKTEFLTNFPADRTKILGIPVDWLTRRQAIDLISARIVSQKNKHLFFVVTAYSEFFVTAKIDAEFRKVLSGADLVLPDGVGPLAARDYLSRIRLSDQPFVKFVQGLVTGIKVFLGKVGQPVPGVWLFSVLVQKASESGWRVYLLGGFGQTASRLARQLEEKYPDLLVGYDAGDQAVDPDRYSSQEAIGKINDFQPDLLFVAYGPVKQEKWIARNKDGLKVKVAMGMGGTFDEVIGNVAPAPKIVSNMGLKWVWRLLLEPRRIRRILNAYPIFPLMVFREALGMK